MVYGACLLHCNIEFLTNHLFVDTFRPAVPTGNQHPQPTIPNHPPISIITNTIPGTRGEPAIQGAAGLYATSSMNVRYAGADRCKLLVG